MSVDSLGKAEFSTNSDRDSVSPAVSGSAEKTRGSLVQSYTYNGKTIQVDLREVPEFSTSSLEILKHLKVQVPDAFQSAAPLKERLRTMEKTTKLLKESQDKYIQNKVLALLSAVGSVAGLAMAVLLSGNEFAEGSAPGAIVFLGLGVISWDLWTRASTLQGRFDQQTETIQQTLSEYQRNNDRTLPEAHRFYSGEASQKLIPLIDAKMKEAEEYLLKVDHPVPDPERKAFVKAYIADCKKAKIELQKLVEFYSCLKV